MALRFGAFVCALLMLFLLTSPMQAQQLAASPPASTAPHSPWVIWEDGFHNQLVDDSWLSIRTFRLTEPRQEPIRVFIEPSSLAKAQHVAAVKAGFNAWADALGHRFRVAYVSDPHQAEITVAWVSRFPDPEQAGETQAGIGQALVKIKPVGLPDNIIQGVILHELGHALGIESHSPFNSDIMRTERPWQSEKEYRTYKPSLSHRDKLAIQRLYSPHWVQGEDLYRAVLTRPGLMATQP